MTEVETLDQLYTHVTEALGDRKDVHKIERSAGRVGTSVKFKVDSKTLHRSIWKQIESIPYSEKSVSMTMDQNTLRYRVTLYI